MNSAVASVLNKALGTFVENLDSKQLKLSIFSGEVELHNLSLKSDFIRTLGLPFLLKRGNIGKIWLSIPWTSLSSSPLHVVLENISLVLKPKRYEEWDPQIEIKNLVDYKQEMLMQFENFNKQEVQINQEAGYMESLVQKIVDNLQITINSIYVRFEDKISSSQRFTAGAFIKTVKAVTCDKDWNEKFVVDLQMMRKFIQLEQFGIFFDYGDGFELSSEQFGDGQNQGFFEMVRLEQQGQIQHKYISNPTTFTLMATINKQSEDFQHPFIDLKFFNQDAKFNFESPIITHVFNLLDFINKYSQFQSGITAQLNEQSFNKDTASNYRRVYKEWLIKMRKKEKGTNPLKAQLEAIERQHFLKDCMQQRFAVIEELKLIDEEKKVQAHLEATKANQKKGLASRIGNYFWGQSEEDKQQEEMKNKQELDVIETKLSKIRQERSMYQEDINKIAKNAQIEINNEPKDYKKIVVSINVESFQIQIADDKQPCLNFQLEGFNFELIMRPTSIKTQLLYKSIELQNLCYGVKDFPYLLKSGAWSINFDTITQIDLQIDAEESFMVFVPEVIFQVLGSYFTAMSTKADLSAYWDSAGEKTNEYLKLGQEYIDIYVSQAGLLELNVDIQIKAPVIFLPFNSDSLSQGYLVLDTGNIIGGQTEVTKNGAQYDRSFINVNKFHLVFVQNSDNILSWHQSECESIIKPLDICFNYDSLKNQSLEVTKYYYIGDFGDIQFELSDKQLLKIYQLQAKVDEIQKLAYANIPEEPQPVQQEVVEYDLNQKYKEMSKVAAAIGEFNINSICVKFVDQGSDLMKLDLKSFNIIANIKDNGNIDVNFNLYYIQLQDKRQDIEFKNILSFPQNSMYLSSDFNNQVEGTIKIKPNEDLIDCMVFISELRIVATPDFVKRLLDFAYQRLEQVNQNSQQQTELRQGPIASTSIVNMHRRFNLDLTSIEIWLPETKRKEDKIVSSTLSVNISFTSLQQVKWNYDAQNLLLSTEYKFCDDEATIEIRNFGVVVGYLQQNDVFSIENREIDFINPSRFYITYRCQTDEDIILDVHLNLESLCIYASLEDIKSMMKLANNWTVVQQQQPQPTSIHQQQIIQQTLTNFELVSDALQITIMDDTEQNVINLFYLQFSNLSAAGQVSAVTQFDFCALAIMDYYNFKLTTWESLIENFDIKILCKQEDSSLPQKIIVSSEKILNVNATYAFLETYKRFNDRFFEEARQQRDRSQSKTRSDNLYLAHGMFVYEVINNLGEDAILWFDCDKNRSQWQQLANERKVIEQKTIEDIYMQAIPNYKNSLLFKNIQAPAALNLEIQGYKIVKGLVIEDTQLQGFALQDKQVLNRKIECVLNLNHIQRVKYVSLETSRIVINNTEFLIRLTYGNDSIDINASQAQSLPIQWLQDQFMTRVKGYQVDYPIFFNQFMEYAKDVWIVIENFQYTTDSNVIQNVIQINPAMFFQNLLPCPISIYRQDTNELVLELPASAKRCITDIDPQNYPNFYLTMNTTDRCIRSDQFEISQEENSADLLEEFQGSKITIQKKRNFFLKCSNYTVKYRQLHVEIEKDSIYSRVYMILSNYFINNKTNYQIQIDKSNTLLIPQNSLIPYSTHQTKLQVRLQGREFGQPSKWSKPFNITTFGISGNLRLENKVNKKSLLQSQGIPPIVDLGIRLSPCQPPFHQTQIVYIVPRYLISNHLGYPIYIRQYSKAKPINIVHQLNQEGSLVYQFEVVNHSKAIQISMNGVDWSSAFKLDDFEDFQIKLEPQDHEKVERPMGKGKMALVNLFKRGVLLKDWNLPSRLNGWKHFARVVITSEDDATIFISFITPQNPEYVISNFTDEQLCISQDKQNKTVVPPRVRCPYTFDNHMTTSRKITIKSANNEQTFNIEKIKKFQKLGKYEVGIEVKGMLRELIIREKEKDLKRQQKFSFLGVLSNNYIQSYQNTYILELPGIGISLVDNEPSEQLYIGIIGINIKYKIKQLLTLFQDDYDEDIRIRVDNMQIDNMNCEHLYPVLLAPRNVPKNSDDTPFFQSKVVRSTSLIKMAAMLQGKSITKYSWLEIQFQEINLLVNQEMITRLLNISNKMMEILYGQTYEPKNFDFTPSEFKQIIPELDTDLPTLSQKQILTQNKTYFEFIHIGALKIFLSFRKQQGQVDIEVNPLKAFGILGILQSLAQSFMNITDSPLLLSELILIYSFQTFDNLTQSITKNYIRQGILQFYKIIGSSDMLGNPVGIVDKLGTGVFEFFNEPRKGILKGPKGFAQGIGKGVRSLVGNIISAGFGSVSRITGSLYGVVQDIGKEKGQKVKELKESSNIFTGIYHGLKGGLGEIFSGISGLFTKPYQGAKREGAKGFVKGLGKGLVGVVTAPFSAVLRLTSNITSGISNTGQLLAKGRVKPRGRLRFPRNFKAKRILEPYNGDLAECQELLKNMQLFTHEKIVYLMHVNEDIDIMLILTVRYVILLLDTNLSSFLQVQKICACQVHKLDNMFFLCLSTNKQQIIVHSQQFSPLAKMYTAITSLPTKLDKTKGFRTIKVKEKLCRSCC